MIEALPRITIIYSTLYTKLADNSPIIISTTQVTLLLTHGLAQQLVPTGPADGFFPARPPPPPTPVRALRAWAGRVARE